jgi:hypothetical protein
MTPEFHQDTRDIVIELRSDFRALKDRVERNSEILERLDRMAMRAEGRNGFLKHAVETVKMLPAAALVTGALWLIERMPIPR